MHINSWRGQVTVAWMILVSVTGFAADTATAVGWTVVIAVALIPPVLLNRFAGEPELSMSERIRDVTR